jgi:hypothetical protein
VFIEERAMNDRTNPRTTRLAIDRHPGTLPRITSDGASIVYEIVLAGRKDRGRLVLRCDADDEIWVSIPQSE